MPQPDEIAVVIANGQVYNIWTTIEVSRTYANVVAEMRLTVAEFSSTGAFSNLTAGFAALQLMPGDECQAYLAGRIVISGRVFLRQVTYNATMHAVQIGVCSKVQNTIVSSVDGKPGQYKNQTLKQIANACFGKVGVSFNIVGSPPGAEKVFKRIMEHVGESRFQFIERLCRMRNVHMIDDRNGNVLAARGPVGGPSAELEEGRNILRANLVLRDDEYADWIRTVGQNNSRTAEPSRDVSATAESKKRERPLVVVAPHLGDGDEMRMHTNHMADWQDAQYVDGVITVPGWLMDDGSIWFDHVGERVRIYSPMLVPSKNLELWISGIIHRQSDATGTETDVLVSKRLSHDPIIETGGDAGQTPSLGPAKVDPPDTSEGGGSDTGTENPGATQSGPPQGYSPSNPSS